MTHHAVHLFHVPGTMCGDCQHAVQAHFVNN